MLLGAPWIPIEDLLQFCEDTFKLRPLIKRDPIVGMWDVVSPPGVRFSVEATSTWGTSRVSAFKLLEHLLNHKTTVVEDEDVKGNRHVNTEETMLAQQKKRELQARFSEWIWEDNERTRRLAALYNTLYNGVVPTIFNGDHLSFPGMDPFWQQHLYPWQRDFIARMIHRRSGLCAFPVGAGKTKIQVAGAMTLRRMGLINKAAILVPNHLIEQITAEARQLYPSANILMISRDDLARERRRIFMARIATGDYDLVIMTHSAFEAIDVHPHTRRAYMQEQIRAYKQVLCSMNRHSEDRADQRRIKRIEKQLQRLYEQLKELLDGPHDAGITFEQLGISCLIVDEAHFFKNLGLPTNQEKLQATASRRAQDMLMKLRWLEQQHKGRPFAFFFTATPISNSMVEALVMLWYLNRDGLDEYEIAGVDDFASLYIETEEKIEVQPNGAGFRMYERPSKFINLPELMHLLTSIADIRSADILTEKRPDRVEHTIDVEPTDEVIEYVNWLVKRSEAIQCHAPMEIDQKLDNMLWITTDGRKAALWMGLHGRREKYPAKLHAIATEMAKVFHRWQKEAAYLPGRYKSFQIGFCDQGTPSKEKGDQVYGELKQLLIEKGIPAQGIRYIHEAETDAAKAVLFEQCRSGEVAILLGSTGKLGTGTNIQTRCAAIHHCDAPWRPDEVKQREGRGQRPGNLYPQVEIFYYVQRRTFDAYSWQILTNKAEFFDQIYSAKVSKREIAYSEDSALSFGQVKAAATGDILLLEHANVSLSVDGFERLHASFRRARERDRQEARALRDQAASAERELQRYQHIAQVVAAYTNEQPFMTPERLLLATREARRDYIANAVLAAIKENRVAKKIGTWQDVPIFFVINTLSIQQYTLAIGDPYTGIMVPCNARWLEQENRWRFAGRIEQFFQELPGVIEEQAGQIKHMRHKAEEFEAQAQVPFPQHEAWQTAVARKRELDHYIAFAAKAASQEDLQQLAEMRQRLLETAPKELLGERRQAQQTTRVLLPPRNPNATESSHTKTATPVEVVETAPKEQSIEEVVSTIKQSVIGSKATVVFGQIEPRKKRKSRKKQDVTEVTDLWSVPDDMQETSSNGPGKTLWDMPAQTEEPARKVEQPAPVSLSSAPQQSCLWE